MASITRFYNALVASRTGLRLSAMPVVQRQMCTSAKEGVTHKVTDFEKKVLVWTKKYKTVAEVPESVAVEVIDRARNRFRIKICNYLMVLTLAGCGLMIYSGREAKERGESVHKTNVEWHRQYNKQTNKTEKDYADHFEQMAKAGAEERDSVAKK